MYCRYHSEFHLEPILNSIQIYLVLDRQCKARQTWSFHVLCALNAQKLSKTCRDTSDFIYPSYCAGLKFFVVDTSSVPPPSFLISEYQMLFI
jgi:hypothetical protein